MGCNLKIVSLAFTIFGVVLIVVAAILGFSVLPGIIDDEIDENVILDSKGTDQFERFQELPFALNFSITFFNVTNPAAVMAGTEKPKVKEIGPIVYAKQLQKVYIKFVDDDNTIKFNSNKTHTYQPVFSKIKENQKVTIINTPLVSVMQLFEDYADSLGSVGEYLLGLVIKGYPAAFRMAPGTVFHEVDVSDYTFKGYQFCDPRETKGAAKALCAFIRLKGSPALEILPKRIISFAFFRQKQGVEAGSYEVERGINSITSLGQIVRYAGKNRTSWWKDEGNCNQVKGTDSTIYAPHNDKTSVFTIFNSEICRTVELEYTDEVEYKGIPGYRSTIKKSMMDWSLDTNRCYCLGLIRDMDGNKKCFPSGFTDMYHCLHAPIVLSYPHFLWAKNKTYTDSVEGLNPIEDDHKIYIDMEPNTGSPMVGHKRIQFNVLLRNYGGKFDMLVAARKAIIPILWVDENMSITDDLVEQIKDQYLTPVRAVLITKWVLIGVGIALTLGCGYLYIYKRRSR